jgi:hypothetical protein
MATEATKVVPVPAATPALASVPATALGLRGWKYQDI